MLQLSVRPFVTTADIPTEHYNPDGLRWMPTLFGISNNLFVEMYELANTMMVTVFKYDWETGRIDRLHAFQVGLQFVICKQSSTFAGTVAADLKDGKLILYEITETELLMLAECKVEEGNPVYIKSVKGSESLVAVGYDDRTVLYHLTPHGMRKISKLGTINSTGYELRLENDTIALWSRYSITPLIYECVTLKMVRNSDVYNAKYIFKQTGYRINNSECQTIFTFTLPNLGKAIFAVIIDIWDNSDVTRFSMIDGKLVKTSVPNWPERNYVTYCTDTGLLYLDSDSDSDIGVETFNLETFERQRLVHAGKRIMTMRSCWLPLPTRRDLIIKYKPILEAHTKLPTDLCLLIVSYLSM